MLKFYLTIMLTAGLSLSFAGLFGQGNAFEVRGLVTSESGEPLPGANILEKGTTNGTVTSADGTFVVSVSGDRSILVFSFIGYTRQEIEVNGRTRIDVSMAPDLQSLDEIVVVGYGEQSRKTLTTSISKYHPEELDNIPINTI